MYSFFYCSISFEFDFGWFSNYCIPHCPRLCFLPNLVYWGDSSGLNLRLPAISFIQTLTTCFSFSCSLFSACQALVLFICLSSFSTERSSCLKDSQVASSPVFLWSPSSPPPSFRWLPCSGLQLRDTSLCLFWNVTFPPSASVPPCPFQTST